MKKVLALLLRLAGPRIGAGESFHNDRLRANQGQRNQPFSFWRALVS
jgi:hypothetical protein